MTASLSSSPPPDPVGLLQWAIGGLSLLFLGLLQFVRKEAHHAMERHEEIARAELRDVHQKLTDAEAAVPVIVTAAIKVSEDKLAGSIMNAAALIANTSNELRTVKNEIWAKIDEFNAAKVADARTLVTRDDLIALESRIDRRIEEARTDSREDRRVVAGELGQRITDLNRTLVDMQGRHS